MSGRRKHSRFVVGHSEAVLRVLKDVVVSEVADDHIIALSGEPAVRGDRLTIDVLVDGCPVRLAVRVADSHPILVAGAVRHRLRLFRIEPAVPLEPIAGRQP